MLHNSNNNNISLRRPSIWSGVEVDERTIEETQEFILKKKKMRSTWYVLDYDQKLNKYMCVIEGDIPEIGYFTIEELKKVKHKQGFLLDKEKYANSCSIQNLIDNNNSNSPIICS